MKIFADHKKIIPALYTLAGILFLVAHFLQFEGFSEEVNNFRVSGKKNVPSGLFPARIRHFKIEISDLRFRFRPFRPATLITTDGIRHPLNVLGWKAVENGINLEFTYNVYVFFQWNNKNLQLRLVLPATILPEVDSLELPLEEESLKTLKITKEFPWELVSQGQGGKFAISLPQPDTGSNENLHFNLNKTSLSISKTSENNVLGAYSWLNLYPETTEEEMNASVIVWLDRQGKKWLKEASLSENFFLNSGNGGENIESQEGIFDSKLAALTLSRSLEGGNFPTVLESVQAIWEKGNARENWILGPWLGNIVNLGLQYREKLYDYARELLVYSAGNFPDLDTTMAESLEKEWPLGPSIPELLVDTGNETINADLMNTIKDYLIGKETNQRETESPTTEKEGSLAEEVIGLFGLLSAYRQDNLDKQNNLDWLLSYVEEYVIPQMVFEGDGLWLLNKDKLVYPELNIKAGLMIRALAHENENLQQIGRQLIISVLNLGNGDKDIPRSFALNDNTISDRKGITAPQTIYSLLMNNSFVPRHLSLYEELGEPYWAITGADNFTAKRTGGEIRLEMDFPAGYTHHIVLGNVGSVSSMDMYGIPWRPDKNFQKYYAGWYHDSDNRLLFIKIQHRSERETIRIIM